MADHLDPRRHDVQFLADLFADLLELGAVVVAMTGILGELMDHFDAGQFGG